MQRWLQLAPKSTKESIRNLIVSVHNRTLQAGQYLLFPLAAEEELFALDVFLDISDKPQAGLFQLKQVEKFEKHWFKECAAQMPKPEPISYEAAFQILNEKYNCSAEEFTVWCRWDVADLQPYKDRELKRPFSLRREEVTSLADCLLGTFFNKAQIESFCPDERYITYRELVRRIMGASGYDEARAEQLVASKFDHDRGKDDAPDEISDTNTLGMNWTFNFKGKAPKNAAYEKEKIDAFVLAYFAFTSNTTSASTGQEQRESQLHKLINKVDTALHNRDGKKPEAKSVWKELQDHHKEHDLDRIIQEISDDCIAWRSRYGNESSLDYGSFAATLSKVRGKFNAKR